MHNNSHLKVTDIVITQSSRRGVPLHRDHRVLLGRPAAAVSSRGMPCTSYNFSSGPATLPEEVLRSAQAALVDLDGSGIGILEHSHRGKEFGARARAHRGRDPRGRRHRRRASRSCSSPPARRTTSRWCPRTSSPRPRPPTTATPACGPARRSKRRAASASSTSRAPASRTSRATPRELAWSAVAGATSTTRATRRSTARSGQRHRAAHRLRWCATPRATSSAARSRSPTTALIYAGAQKNLGPSGISLVIARKDFVETGATRPAAARAVPHVRAEQSMHNTPNTFGIYVIGEVVRVDPRRRAGSP